MSGLLGSLFAMSMINRYKVSSGTLVGFTGMEPDVTIPKEVTVIGEKVFASHSSVHTVMVPEQVTRIGAQAFSGCANLESVYFFLCKELKVLEEKCFFQCKKLKSITIPEGTQRIGDEAFSGCESLEEVFLPNSLTVLGADVFKNCGRIKRLMLPEALYEAYPDVIGKNCSAEILFTSASMPQPPVHSSRDPSQVLSFVSENSIQDGLYIVPQGILEIGSRAFWRKPGLKKVVIHDGVTKIGSSAFEKCSGLEQVVLPGTLRELGDCAFEDCTALTAIGIPKGVSEIPYGAFQGCKALQSVVLPDSVTSIGDQSFRDCQSLESLVIPNSVKHIGYAAFRECSSLQAVLLPERMKPSIRRSVSGCENLALITLPDALESVDGTAFQGTGIHKPLFTQGGRKLVFVPGSAVEGAYVIPEGVEIIGAYAFSGLEDLKEVVCPSSLKTIETNAFYDCRVRSMTIGKSVDVKPGALNGSHALTELKLEGASLIQRMVLLCKYCGVDIFTMLERWMSQLPSYWLGGQFRTLAGRSTQGNVAAMENMVRFFEAQAAKDPENAGCYSLMRFFWAHQASRRGSGFAGACMAELEPERTYFAGICGFDFVPKVSGVVLNALGFLFFDPQAVYSLSEVEGGEVIEASIDETVTYPDEFEEETDTAFWYLSDLLSPLEGTKRLEEHRHNGTVYDEDEAVSENRALVLRQLRERKAENQ